MTKTNLCFFYWAEISCIFLWATDKQIIHLFIIFIWIGSLPVRTNIRRVKCTQQLSSRQYFCGNTNLNFEPQRKVNHRSMNEFNIIFFCTAGIRQQLAPNLLVCCSAINWNVKISLSFCRFVRSCWNQLFEMHLTMSIVKMEKCACWTNLSKVHLFRKAMNVLSPNRWNYRKIVC